MSTPEQPLTRKQLRELERTGALPVQSAPTSVEDAAPSAPVAPLPRAAEPVAPQPTPVPDSSIDLGSAPLTRRQARQQERIRTASVPVITPDVAGAHVVAAPEATAETPATPELIEGVPESDVHDSDTQDSDAPADLADLFAEAPAGEDDVPTAEDDVPTAEDDVPTDAEGDASGHADADVSDDASDQDDANAVTDDESVAAGRNHDAQWSEGAVFVPEETPDAGDLAEDADPVDDEEAVEEYAPVAVGPQFGAALLAGEPEVAATDLPPSFDELIARNASSATSSTPSALILSQTPTSPSLAGPITATGEVIITGSYRLPEGLGSSGVDPRSADGKDVDAVLLDGELPAASSPTPIAASAAISTVRGADEIIRPPAPEKGSKLILSLAITAGVLAVAVIAVLVVALTNGVFS